MTNFLLRFFLLSSLASGQSDPHRWFDEEKLAIQFPLSSGDKLDPFLQLGRIMGARYGIVSISLSHAALPAIKSTTPQQQFPLGLNVKLPENLSGDELLLQARQLIEKNPNAPLIVLDASKEQFSALSKQWNVRTAGPLTGQTYWDRRVAPKGDFLSLDRFLPSAPLRDPNGKPLHWLTHYPVSEFAKQPPENLIRLMAEVTGKGGNLVLDFDEAAGDTKSLQALGQWLRINGESIFGSEPGPFDRMPFYGRATRKGDSIYLHVFQWPKDGNLPLTGLQAAVLSAELLDGGRKVEIVKQGNETNLQLGTKAADAAVTVVKLRLASPWKVDPYVLSDDSKGVLEVPVAACEFEARPGQLIRKLLEGNRVVLANWKRAIDVPGWKVRLNNSGRYAVSIVYRAAAESAGATYTISMNGASIGIAKGIVEASSEFKTFSVGEMELESGNFLLVIQPENKPGIDAMTFEKLILRRIGN